MYRIAICDDEMFFIENLKKLIPDCYQVDVFTSGKELLKSRVEEYHIFLLDIEMPEMRGFEVAEQLNRMLAEPLIIFITGYEQLVFESFDYRPFDFLLEDIMLTGVVRKETINYIFENDKMIYDYIKFVYDQAEFIGTVEQTFMENIALEARVFCDSERENALAKQAVDGIEIEIDDSDCWLSSYTTNVQQTNIG